MAVTASDQAQAEGELSPAQSADSFPKSHQILIRDFSNASTAISDADLSREGSTAASRLKELEGFPNGKIGTADSPAKTPDAKETSQSQTLSPGATHSGLSDLSTLAVQGSTAAGLADEATESDLADPKANSQTTELPIGSAKPASAPEVQAESSPERLAKEETKPTTKAANVQENVPREAKEIAARPIEQRAQNVAALPKWLPKESQASENVKQTSIEAQQSGGDAQSQKEASPSAETTVAAKDSDKASEKSKDAKKAEPATSEQDESVLGNAKLNGLGSENTSEHLKKTDDQDKKLSGNISKSSAHSSKSELNPVCEPFVPSPQTPKKQESAKPSKGLNANATEFTPSGPSSHKTTPSDASTEQIMWPPMQFGDLPESLAASPHQSIANVNVAQLPEWTAQKYANYANGGEAANPNQRNDWPEAWNGGYSYDNFYTDPQGYSYAMQPDGSWLPCWNHNWAGDSQWGYNSGEFDYEQEANGDADKGSRSRHRPDRRRAGRQWGRASDTAFVHILQKQFKHSPELIGSVLDLHEGSMRGTLDMLGQLEAESNGQLLTDQQDAPELNEENFPSLAAPGEEAGQPTSLSKGGFANAVKAVKASIPTADASSDPALGEEKRTSETPIAVTEGLSNGEATRSWDDEAVEEEVDVRSQAQAKIEFHSYHRDESFEQAVWAAVNRDEAAASYWAEQGKQQSDMLVAACVEAEQALYKHRSVALKRRRARMLGPIDLVGLSEKEALNTLEEVVSEKTQVRQRSPRSIEHSFYVLFGSQKGSKIARGVPQSIEEWIKATQTKHTKKEPGFIELFI